MSQNRLFATVALTLKDDLHDFDTFEIQLEPVNNTNSLQDHFDNPEDEFRYEILNELRDTRMWKATLHNPDGKPYKIELGTIQINLETEEIESLDFDKTSHHSVKQNDLTIRD
jgi:hypothetical protein